MLAPPRFHAKIVWKDAFKYVKCFPDVSFSWKQLGDWWQYIAVTEEMTCHSHWLQGTKKYIADNWALFTNGLKQQEEQGSLWSDYR